jgi:hypothetical protein
MEVVTARSVKNTLNNCLPVMEELNKNKKIIMSFVVKYLREGCCETEGHSTNVGEAGYRRNLLNDLANITDVTKALCGERGSRTIKWSIRMTCWG